jgi:hypothetical protein
MVSWRQAQNAYSPPGKARVKGSRTRGRCQNELPSRSNQTRPDWTRRTVLPSFTDISQDLSQDIDRSKGRPFQCQPRTQETDTPIHGTLAERRCTVLRDPYGNNGGKAKNRTTLSESSFLKKCGKWRILGSALSFRKKRLPSV